MATYFGINSNYDFFGNAQGSTLLSDYGLIRSGAYKKLMNAYYGRDNVSSDSSDSASDTEKTENLEKINLKSIQSEAGNLKQATSKLRSGKVFEPVENKETGVKEIDKDAIKKQVKAFVDSYNKTIEAAGNADTKSVLRKTIWMINDVKANAGLLEDVGINIGTDNKLTLDESKLDEAKMSTMKTVFSGSGSVADKVMQKASELDRLSGAAMNTASKSRVSYTPAGDYTSFSTSSIYNSFFQQRYNLN